MIPIQHIAASQMFFLIEGMNDAARRNGLPPIGVGNRGFYERIATHTQGGVVDFVTGLSPIIDALTACTLVALESSHIDFPGVFEYEVTSSIGDWLFTTNFLSDEINQDYRAAENRVYDAAFEFFGQLEDNRIDYPTFRNEAIRIGYALADGTYQFRGASR